MTTAPDNITPEDKTPVPDKPVVTADVVQEFLNTDEGKAMLQPKLDSFYSKGLETWKTNNLSKIVQEEMSKLNPDETPEQKRIRELEEKLSAQERNAFKSELQSKTVKELTAQGLPVELATLVNFDSEDAMQESITQFGDIFKSYADKTVADRLKDSGRTPDGKQNTGTDPKAMTREKLLKLSTVESTKFFTENPEQFRKLMAQK